MPCRSTVCTHSQCFDGSFFLQLQEQAPTWTCPVCNKSILYETLAVDQYVKDILQSTTTSTEQVTIEPDGQWRPVVQGEDGSADRSKTQVRASYDNDSGDDIIEVVQDSRPGKIKVEASSAALGIAQQTPPLSSREPSTAASGRDGKRPSAVIDLTLSDDDDDEPRRPAKRTHTSQPTSHQIPTSATDARITDNGTRRPDNIRQGSSSGVTNGLSAEWPIEWTTRVTNGYAAGMQYLSLPLQPGQASGSFQNGRPSPWPTEPSVSSVNGWPGAQRDGRGSYSGSPG